MRSSIVDATRVSADQAATIRFSNSHRARRPGAPTGLIRASVLAGALALFGAGTMMLGSAPAKAQDLNVNQIFQLEGDAFDTNPTSDGAPLSANETTGLEPAGVLDGQGNHPDMDDWAKFGAPAVDDLDIIEDVCTPVADGDDSCGHVAGPGDPQSADVPHPGDPAGDGHTGGNAGIHFYIQDVDFRSPPNSDDVFKQGTSLNLDICDWTLDLSFNTPNKDDILQAAAAFYTVTNTTPVPAEPETMFVAAMTLAAPNGSAKTLYWLLRNDLVVITDADALADPDLVPFIGKFRPPDFDPLNDPCDGLNGSGGRFELHAPGDLAFAADYQNGGSQVEVVIFEWQRDILAIDGEIVDITATVGGAGAGADNCQDGTFVACATANSDAAEPDKNAAPKVSKSPQSWDYQANLSNPNLPGAGDDAIPTTTLVIGPPLGTGENFGQPILSSDFPGTTFFEGGINLSAIPNFQIGCFGTFIGTTVASASVTASMKDAAVGRLNSCDISVTKMATEFAKVGDTLEYTITIENTGALPLDKSSVLDTLVGELVDDVEGTACDGPLDTEIGSCSIVTIDCEDANALDLGVDALPMTLNPGDLCTIDYDITLAGGATPGFIDNTVDVTYTSGAGDSVMADASATVEVFEPSITFDKTGDAISKVGDVVNYVITLDNTSSADTPDLECTITDALLGVDEDVTLAWDAPNHVINAMRQTMAGDPDPLVNTAEVVCSPIGFPNLLNEDDDHSVDLFQASITFDKTGDAISKVGDVVNYVITLDNTSSADTPDLECTITDALLGVDEDVTLAWDAPNHVINAMRQTMAGDPDPLVNTAEVVCSPIGFPNLLNEDDDHSVDLFQASITFDKTGDAISKVGDVVNYVITLDNTSSADTPDLECTITDALLGVDEDVTLAWDAPNHVINAMRQTMAGDPDPLVNTAEVVCSPIGFPNLLNEDDDHSVDLFQASITFDKTGDAISKVGDVVNYVITLDNTSSADTPDLECTITDALLGVDEDVTLAWDAPNHVINAMRQTMAGDPDPLVNTAEVVCSPIGFPNLLNEDDDHSVDLFQASITFDKTGDAISKVGDVVNYVITLDNTSSADTPDLECTITDALLGVDEDVTLAWDAPNHVINAMRQTMAGDPDPLVNTAEVVCSPIGFPNLLNEDDDHSVDLVQPSVDVTMVCHAQGSAAKSVEAGGTLEWDIVITNTGDTALENLNFSQTNPNLSDLADISCGSLAASGQAGDSCSFTDSFVTARGDGSQSSTAQATYDVAIDFGNNLPNKVMDDASDTCEVIDPDPFQVRVRKVTTNGSFGPDFDIDTEELTPVQTLTDDGLLAGDHGLNPDMVTLGTSTSNDPASPPEGANANGTDTLLFGAEEGLTGGAARSFRMTEIGLPAMSSFIDAFCWADDNEDFVFDAGEGTVGSTDLISQSVEFPAVSGDDITCVFINEIPGEGCTPGYWKQEHHFDSWPASISPVNPADIIDEHFVDDTAPDILYHNAYRKTGNGPPVRLGDQTMVEALSFQGGDDLRGKAEILMRHAVAALLNEVSPDVNTEGNPANVVDLVITALEQAVDENDGQILIEAANELKMLNERECPLN